MRLSTFTLLSLCCCWLNFTFAQTESNFITPISGGKQQLTQIQQQALGKIESLYKPTRVELVKLGSIGKIHKNGYLSLKIPGFDKPLQVKTRQLEAKSEQDFLYTGSVQDSLGDVILSARKGIVRGNVAFSMKQFELVSIGADTYAWITLNPLQTGSCGLEKKPISSTLTLPKLGGAREGECVNPLRVLLLHTPRAIAQDPNIQGLMDQCIGTWQTVAGAQGLNDYRTNIYWVGRQEYNFGESNNIANDRDRFVAGIGPLREQFGADMVILFTENAYATGNGEVFGIAQGIGPSGDGSIFAALVTVNQAAGNLTMVHEMGHLLGVRHNDCDLTATLGCDNTPGSNHGYKFIYRNGAFNQYLNRATTVMHENHVSLESSGLVTWQRLARFSDPYYSMEGEPTGTVNTHNNRPTVFNGLLAARNYRTGGSQLGGSISGPQEGLCRLRTATDVFTQKLIVVR